MTVVMRKSLAASFAVFEEQLAELLGAEIRVDRSLSVGDDQHPKLVRFDIEKLFLCR